MELKEKKRRRDRVRWADDDGVEEKETKRQLEKVDCVCERERGGVKEMGGREVSLIER